jgi:hypothetical protein
MHLSRVEWSRVGLWAAVWLLTLGALGIFIVPPERCTTPSAAEVERSAAATVEWLVANQYDDDRWRYEFDRETATDLPGYNIVRHAGVMTALYQRHAWVGDPDAFATAERGLDWIDAELVVAGDGIAVLDGRSGSTGGSALLAAALVFRRDAIGATDRDPLIAALARFMVDQQLPNGAVSARYDLTAGAPVPDEFSPFFTGEAMWALALAGDRLDVPEWREAAFRTLDYVALERDDAEPEFPPNDDHWAGYALGELAVDGLQEHHRDYVRRLAGLWSAEVRFDSQRTGEGLNRVARGGVGRDGVQGTNLEGMAGLWRAAAVDDGLSDVRDDLTDRIGCAADMLVSRQVTDAEAALEPTPEATAGAWFRNGLTRMDVQQHALGGLTGAWAVLATSDPPEGSAPVDLLEYIATAALVAALVLPRRRTTVGVDPVWIGGSAAFLIAAALVGPEVLAAYDVSPTSARLAVGVLVVATLVAGWIGRDARSWPIAASYPPAAVTVVVVAADLGRLAAVVATVAGLAVAEGLSRSRRYEIVDRLVGTGREALLILAATVAVVSGAIGL